MSLCLFRNVEPEYEHAYFCVCVFYMRVCSYMCVCVCVPVCVCQGVQVTVREDKRYAMLFQSVVLQCQFQTPSTQTPVVQWWYKSYCRDRTRQAFAYPDTHGAPGGHGGRGGLGGVEQGYASHLECPDSSRTVRIIASISGASITLSEHYKDRDISILNSKMQPWEDTHTPAETHTWGDTHTTRHRSEEHTSELQSR